MSTSSSNSTSRLSSKASTLVSASTRDALKSANKKIASKPPSFGDPQSFVTILVGEGSEARPFTLHKDLLCKSSPFFDKAFNGDFWEAETQTMILEDIEPSIFGLFICWLYSGYVALRKAGLKGEETLTQTPVQLAKLWVIAERFMLPKLQNRVIDEIFRAIEVMSRDIESFQLTGETPPALMEPFIQFAYTSDAAMLQSVAVDRFAFACSQSMFLEMIDRLPVEAVVDVSKALRTTHEMCAEDFHYAED